ncbi:MAG: excinuclease ABC subunit UvrA, partial [Sphingobacterium sp.]
MTQHKTVDLGDQNEVEVFGARVHNLKNIDVSFPRNQLVVITGLSGSGKSSLAFDTIYAEGQRRYMETFSAYSRQFLGGMERPDVDKISGLSPVISIEQKTTSKNPRSTVGTITEIYDFLRLLYARIGEAFSYASGRKMERMSDDEITDRVLKDFDGEGIYILAPVVKGRKGHYRELFEQIRKQGYTKVRVDGEVLDLEPKMQVDRYKIHDIEIVVDRIAVEKESRKRLFTSIGQALKTAKGIIKIANKENKEQFFSRFLMDAESGISYDEPQPNTFSFNSPYGACPACDGLGYIYEIDKKIVIPDTSLSIQKGAIIPLGPVRDSWNFAIIKALAKKFEFSLTTPVEKLPTSIVDMLLFGQEEPISLTVPYGSYGSRDFQVQFSGIFKLLEEMSTKFHDNNQTLDDFRTQVQCPSCGGARLKKESLHIKVDDKNIAELAELDIVSLMSWFENIESRLTERQLLIATEIIKEIKTRIGFLLDVGLNYLSLNRSSKSLSGGEAQRIRLATQIGSQLVNVLYILDEPSIGLHQRDNERLISALKNLRDIGNSVLVVEHDKDMIMNADYVIDMGPAAGEFGGEIVAQGTPLA